jgi:hypothetical protein
MKKKLILLEQMLNIVLGCELDSLDSEQNPVAGSFKRDNEPSGSTRGEGFLDCFKCVLDSMESVRRKVQTEPSNFTVRVIIQRYKRSCKSSYFYCEFMFFYCILSY